jgi:hypothetical protein
MTRFIHLDASFNELAIGSDGLAAVYDSEQDITIAAMNVGEAQVVPKKAHGLVTKLNKAKHLGLSTWTQLTRRQLFLLTDDTKHNPAADAKALPFIKPSWYCAATPVASGHKYSAWFVVMGLGGAFVSLDNFVGYVLVAVPGRPPVAGQ